MTRRERIGVGGMHCATCSETIADAVEALDGVSEASANYATDDTTVEYDPGEVSLSAIYEAIESAGYDPTLERHTIEIVGMHCTNCSETVEDALDGLPGVVRADVNYATDEATVEYNPESFSLDTAYEAIEDSGYEPVRETDENSGNSAASSSAAASSPRRSSI